MELIHTVITDNRRVRSAVKRLGIPTDPAPRGSLLSFLISEEHPAWKELRHAIREETDQGGEEVFDRVQASFTAEERAAADVLQVVPTRFAGFPFPLTAYAETVYEGRCGCCFSGGRQVGPFRLQPMPRIGSRTVFQLESVPGELFATLDAWDSVFARFGVGRIDVLTKGGSLMDSIVQLDVKTTVSVGSAELEGRDAVRCERCSGLTYRLGANFAPRPLELPCAMFRSSEAFDCPVVFVTQELFQAITHAKIKGVEFSPCRPA